MNIPIMQSIKRIYPDSADVLSEGKSTSRAAAGQTNRAFNNQTSREKKIVANVKRDHLFRLLDENFGTPTKELMFDVGISRTTFYRWRDEYLARTKR